MATLGVVSSGDTGITLDFGIRSECVKCGAEREPEGRKVLSHGSAYVVESAEPCRCGERRIKVCWSIDVE